MSWLEQALLKALGKIAPQHADTDTNDWGLTKGKKGAIRTLPWSGEGEADGEQLFTTSKPGVVADPEAKAVLDTLAAKDYATQTTLAALLAKVIAAPSTEAKQDAIVTALGLLGTEAKLELIRLLLAGTLTVSGDVNATLIGSNMELYGASIGDRPLAGDVPVGATFTIADPASDFPTWMSDGTDWQEVV